MPAASISRARPRSSAMCVLQIGQSTNRRNCRWTRRLGSGSLIGSPVTDSRVVAGTISPGLNFMFHSLLVRRDTFERLQQLGRLEPVRPIGVDERKPDRAVLSDDER